MSAIYRFLFPTKPEGTAASLFLLAFRVIFGGLLMMHGLQKLMAYPELAAVFPDPLGVGNTLSLQLSIFAEFFCSLGFIFGFLFRLAAIPMIFTMCVAFFVIHANDPFAIKELALTYLIIFVLMYLAGPGKFSIDKYIAAYISKKDH